MSGAQPHIPNGLRGGGSVRARSGLPLAFWIVTVLVGVGAGVAVSLLHLGQPSEATPAAANLSSGPNLTWPARRRIAPNFRLYGQDGRPVSLAAFHGRPVIVTFIDPLCRNLCPVEAGILDKVERGLPAANRPAIVAVSVDPWGDQRVNLLEDDQKWRLVPGWHWAVGSLPQLSAVWRAYEIGVTVTRKEFAGVTVREITHTEVAFLIDPAGYQRALYLFPFQASDVIDMVRQLEGSHAVAATLPTG